MIVMTLPRRADYSSTDVDAHPPGEPVRLQEPQAVLAPLTAAAIFLVVTVDDGGERGGPRPARRPRRLERTVGFRTPAAGWRWSPASARTPGIAVHRPAAGRAAPVRRAARCAPPRRVDARRPAVPHPGATLDLCFELATLIVDRLAGAAPVVDEVHGFKYFDERDLLGFVDGTENPTGPEACAAVRSGRGPGVRRRQLRDRAEVPARPRRLERAAGRGAGAGDRPHQARPTSSSPTTSSRANSHVALNTIVDADGNERQILRDNMPFGRSAAASSAPTSSATPATPSVTEQMLRNMFVGDPPGNHRPDPRLLDRRHRHTVLRAHRRFPRRSAARAGLDRVTGVGGAGRRGHPGGRRLARHRCPAIAQVVNRRAACARVGG